MGQGILQRRLHFEVFRGSRELALWTPNQLVNQLVCQAVNRATSQWVNQLVRQTVNQATNQLVTQLVCQVVNQAVNQGGLDPQV